MKEPLGIGCQAGCVAPSEVERAYEKVKSEGASVQRSPHAGERQVPRLLPRDDLCGLPVGSEPAEWQPQGLALVALPSLRVSVSRAEAGVSCPDLKRCMAGFLPKRPRLRLDPEAYQRLREQVLQRDGWRCQRCGRPGELHVHHIHPRRSIRAIAETAPFRLGLGRGFSLPPATCWQDPDCCRRRWQDPSPPVL
jgi:hypothetical protein